MGAPPQRTLARHDMPQFYLLVALYFVQGIPVGLAFGTIPFLLKSMAKDTSFTTLGIFSMASYPYSLKIFWSPIVDSIYNKKVGRRRSWIIPIQCISGASIFFLGSCISRGIVFMGVDDAFHGRTGGVHDLNILNLTWYFGILVFLCATQDIAVDGWALTILSKQSLSYASTAQTVGINIGYFLSFTVFLSLNSSDFANKYFRSVPREYGLVSLGGYMKFSGIIYILLTLYVVFYTTEKPWQDVLPRLHSPEMKKDDEPKVIFEYEDGDTVSTSNNAGILYVYQCFLKIASLSSVQVLAIIHLTSKIAFQCNEAATNLKLLEQGFKREDLAVTVLIDVPFEILFGYYVAKWSSDSNHLQNSDRGNLRKSKKSWFTWIIGTPGVLTPWLWGYLGRLASAILGTVVVKSFPKDGHISRVYFLTVIIQHLLSSFMSTVQFVGISAFHTRIADPLIGGTYMTLLNTLSNFGGTWPRFIVLSLINYFTIYECKIPGKHNLVYQGGSMDRCTKELGGTITILRDGYFVTNLLCCIFGICLYFGFLKKKSQELQSLPIGSWRCE